MGSLIPLGVLCVVFFLIAVRKVGGVRLQIWQIVLGGALVVLFTGQISVRDALAAINIDVLLFLFGAFVIGEALSRSGYLFHVAYRIFGRAKTVRQLVILIIIATGFFSALLMNDTLAIVATPLMLHYAVRFGISEKLLLLALAFGVTTGSVASPIGNPQNLLIALGGGPDDPFVTFFVYLAVPTALCLLLAYALLMLRFRSEVPGIPLVHVREEITDVRLAFLSRISLATLVLLIGIKVVVVLLGMQIDIPVTYVALIAALPILIGSEKRFDVVRSIDWCTLLFFAALFILIGSVWQSGFFQPLIDGTELNLAAVPVILASGVIISQFVSNVPFVALYLPALMHIGVSARELAALAAGSTIAGNMLIMGAASNVIIIQNAEKRGTTLTFREFAEVGVPLTFLQAVVYWLFLTVIPW